MKKFEFRLEALLRYREHREHEMLQALASAQSDVRECEERIAERLETLALKIEELDRLAASGIDVENYRIYMDYLAGMEAEIEAEKRRLTQLQDIVAERQKELTRRSIQKKMMENLKIRKKEQYFEEMLQLQQKETDDMVLLRKAMDINK